MTAMDDPSAHERQRQAALDTLALDRLAETAYDDLTRLAADLMHTPIALITLVDGDTQWFKSKVGTEVDATPRAISFCTHAIQVPGEVTLVPDATLDPRFATNPLVTGDPNIRFYAGAPLVTNSGHAVGTLCVLDTVAHDVRPEQLDELRFLAQQVITSMERRRRSIDVAPSLPPPPPAES